jgi:hypothetical protein
VADVLPNIVKKTREKYVLPSLTLCVTCTTSFNLWMSRGGHDTFVMVVIFINNLWEPTHVTLGIFKVHNIIVASMANQVRILLNSFCLLDKVIAYVKDKG